MEVSKVGLTMELVAPHLLRVISAVAHSEVYRLLGNPFAQVNALCQASNALERLIHDLEAALSEKESQCREETHPC